MNRKLIPCCFFPTTVVSIDDNIEFLKLMQFNLSLRWPCMIFDDPEFALDYLLNDYQNHSFIKNCVTRHEEQQINHINVDINLKKIHQQIYNINHFDEISVVVVDYTMPKMNGDKVCTQLKNSQFKIILLTGEIEEQEAIELFNLGIIHRYIRKDTPNYLNTLKEAINELQYEYFCILSTLVSTQITKKAELLGTPYSSSLTDLKFVDFFFDYIKKHHIVEFYLVEESGSMLLVNQDGAVSWLLVKTEGDMEAASEFASFLETKIHTANCNAIINREVLVHYFNEDFEVIDANDWLKVLYPCIEIKGQSSNFYCSTVTEPLTTHNIRIEDIVSYQKYKQYYPVL